MAKKENIYKTLAEYKKKLEDMGYKVIYVGLYGSQNYNLDDELSDIDAKAIILPSLHDIIFRKVTSKVYDCENGTIDVKDLITFYGVIKKGNFSYIESIDTEYSIGDKKIKEMFKQFRPNLKSILGAMYEKRKALTHEYPSKTEEFKKWGFDPKQWHHIIRLFHLLKSGSDKSYLSYEEGTCWHGQLLTIKRNKRNESKEYVQMESDDIISEAKTLIPEDYHYDPTNIDDEISKYIEDNLKIELLKNSKTSSAREYRTFDSGIPKTDLKKFPLLNQYDGQDISYIVYESLEVL